jgi:uncharacterized damage-inducible protein DinB
MNAFAPEIFKHNLWANLQLLDFCAALEEEHLAAKVEGTYGAVRETLVHLVASEARYVGEFTRKAPDTRPEDDPFAGFEAMRQSAAASGSTLIDIAERAQPTDVLRGTYRGAPYEMPASMLLIQAINHATEHRAHIATILSRQGLQTPRLDAIGYMEAARA